MDELTPNLLLSAYCQGLFPMADPDAGGEIYWYDPDPRTIIPLDAFHASRRLRRIVRSGVFEMRIDTQFRRVMELCAAPAPGRESTWLSTELIDLFTLLAAHGFAHSVETWQNGELVGGIYGVSVGGLFAGESMFSRVSNASSAALAHLVSWLQQGGFTLFDVQYENPHLLQFGAVEISRQEYKHRLAAALEVEATWPT